MINTLCFASIIEWNLRRVSVDFSENSCKIIIKGWSPAMRRKRMINWKSWLKSIDWITSACFIGQFIAQIQPRICNQISVNCAWAARKCAKRIAGKFNFWTVTDQRIQLEVGLLFVLVPIDIFYSARTIAILVSLKRMNCKITIRFWSLFQIFIIYVFAQFAASIRDSQVEKRRNKWKM